MKPPSLKPPLPDPLLSRLLFGVIAVGLSACVTASDNREDLKAAFHDQIRACYKLPKAAAGTEPVVLEIRLKPDGSLERPPRIIGGPPVSPAAQGALRAVGECTPFALSPDWASRYREWKVMNVRFDTR